MNVNVTAFLQSVNKLIGAIVGGGVIALLVGLHVIPASVGNTLLTVLGVVGAGIGLFLAPRNKPINTTPGVPADEDGDGAAPSPADGTVDEAAEQAISDGTTMNVSYPVPHQPEHAADQ